MRHSGRKMERPIDLARYTPVMRVSVCTGEKTIRLRDNATGRFEELCCIRDDREFEQFLNTYGLSREDVKVVY